MQGMTYTQRVDLFKRLTVNDPAITGELLAVGTARQLAPLFAIKARIEDNDAIFWATMMNFILSLFQPSSVNNPGAFLMQMPDYYLVRIVEMIEGVGEISEADIQVELEKFQEIAQSHLN